MIKKMGYLWRLRHLMAERDMFQTSDLVPLLVERGVVLSREQVYRLVTRPPRRLTMDILVALCDILDCTPNDLIKLVVVNQQVRNPTDGATAADPIPTASTSDNSQAGPANHRSRTTFPRTT